MKTNVGEWLTQRAYLHGDKEGFIGKRGRYTFEEMNQLANRFANYLLDKRVKPGDRIALICTNNEDFVTACFACAKIGAIIVPVNWKLSREETSYILQHAGASVVVYDEFFQEKVDVLKSEVPAQLFISTGGHEEENSFQEILAASINKEPKLRTAGNDTILIMYTPGTTSYPKGVMLSHSNLLAASLSLMHTVDWSQEDRFLAVAPFSHIGGLAPLLANVSVGCATILMEDFDPVAVWRTIEREKITTMIGVPEKLTYMGNIVEQLKPNYCSLRNIMCGASPVPKEHVLKFKELGISIQQVYSTTEYSRVVSFLKESLDLNIYKSMGRTVMHGKVKIVDIETREEVVAGNVGETLCAGPQVFQGYWQDETRTEKVLADGWYHTGDVGMFDEDGYLYVFNRLEDVINNRDHQIYSLEIEATLSEHPEILEAAVVGVPNEEWGQIPRAYIVKESNSDLTKDTVTRFCHKHLASYKVPQEVIFVDALPRNAVGKVLKQLLKLNETVMSEG